MKVSHVRESQCTKASPPLKKLILPPVTKKCKSLFDQRRERLFNEHRRRVKHVSPRLDNSLPKTLQLAHLKSRPKRLQQEAHRDLVIGKSNTRLVQRMTEILNRENQFTKLCPVKRPHKPRHEHLRQREYRRIESENDKLIHRLEHVAPFIRNDKLKLDWEHTKRKMETLCEYPLIIIPDPPISPQKKLSSPKKYTPHSPTLSDAYSDEEFEIEDDVPVFHKHVMMTKMTRQAVVRVNAELTIWNRTRIVDVTAVIAGMEQSIRLTHQSLAKISSKHDYETISKHIWLRGNKLMCTATVPPISELVQEELANMQEMNDAAVTVQKSFRRHHAKQRSVPKAKKEKAAIKVQKTYKKHHLKRESAANIVQRSFRDRVKSTVSECQCCFDNKTYTFKLSVQGTKSMVFRVYRNTAISKIECMVQEFKVPQFDPLIVDMNYLMSSSLKYRRGKISLFGSFFLAFPGGRRVYSASEQLIDRSMSINECATACRCYEGDSNSALVEICNLRTCQSTWYQITCLKDLMDLQHRLPASCASKIHSILNQQ